MLENSRVGVVGVGSMGHHHARIYNELPGAELVGVHDVDGERARSVAREFDTRALPRNRLLEAVDAVSITVPTRHHKRMVEEAIDAGVHMLVEKPFVVDAEEGRELLERADDADLLVQVGHIERYNPAISALRDVLVGAEPLAVAARRQGPPVERDDAASAVFDLMIHDIDIVLSMTDATLTNVTASRVPDRNHVIAQLEFDDGLVASLTASRITQERIRELSITAESCQINVDYMDKSVEIHRHSLPEYITDNGDVRFRHESVIERPTIENGEPLKNELAAFLDAVENGTEVHPDGHDGIRAVEVATEVEAALDPAREAVPEVQNT